MSSSKNTSIFLVTANIASCFDQPKEMLNPWLDELFKVVDEQKPQFIAVHCQEIGGKNYETSMENVETFIRNILNRAKTMDYTRTNIFIDEAFSSAEKFTALGNLYFIRSDLHDIQIWDFIDKKFIECDGTEEHVGSIENVTTKQKSKFPQEFFPECKWSRKGFLRTRWCINGTQFDLVNIHLFHDASNLIAMEKFPSVYTLNRKRAMEHTLDRFHNDEYENVPMFIFGDFNFRVDTKSVVEHLTEGCLIEDTELDAEKTRSYRTNDQRLLLKLSKKGFDHHHHSSIFMKEHAKWLRPFDKELLQFCSRLYEYPISFPPSYPFEEGFESQDGRLYMKTRCPSWCDRIILSTSAKELVDKSNCDIKYDIIGMETRMGDHKPVGLRLEIPVGAGIVRCCSPSENCTNFVHAIDSACFNVGDWCRCQAYPICPSTPNSVCYIQSTTIPACAQVTVDYAERENSIFEKTEKQCVCNVIENECTEQKLTDGEDLLMQTLLKQNNHVCDSPLKRVHSDPVKVRSRLEKMKDQEKPSLAYCHSLDSQRRIEHRLRLRVSSSRLASHHSSSSEEWFEEIPQSPKVASPHSPKESRFSLNFDDPASMEYTSNGSPSSERLNLRLEVKSSYSDQDDSISAILRTPKFVKHKNSLNNLLITDKSACQADNKSQGATSDDSSLRTDGNSSVVPCPCTADNEHHQSSSVTATVVEERSHKISTLSSEEKSGDQCCDDLSCCVLS